MKFKTIITLTLLSTQAFGAHVINRKIYATDIVKPDGTSVFSFPTSAPSAGMACQLNSNGEFTSSAVTSTELGQLSGVTGSLQTQLNGKQGTIIAGTFGSSPNSAGLTLSSGTLTAQPADISHPGGVSLFDQDFGFGEKTFHDVYGVFATAPTAPSLSDAGGADSSYSNGDVIQYEIYSYVIVNGVQIESGIFLSAGTWTEGTDGSSGAVSINWTADTNASVAGYYLYKNVNSTGWQYFDAGNSTSFYDQNEAGSDPSGLVTSYPVSVIIPHIDGSNNVWAVYAPDDNAIFNGLSLTTPLPYTSGGTGRTDGLIGNAVTFDFEGSGIINGSLMSIDAANGEIKNSFGNTIFNSNSQIFNASGVISGDFASYFLYSSGVGVLRWGNGFEAIAVNSSLPAFKADFNSGHTGPVFQLQEQTGSKTEFAIYDNGLTKIQVGTSSANATTASVGGAIFDHFADVGNGTTVETDLYTDTLPQSTLGTNGDKITAEYGLIFANTTATKDVRVYFGGTKIFDAGALAGSLAVGMQVNVFIIRDGSTSIRYTVTAQDTGESTTSFATVGKLTGLTLSNTNILKITGQAGTGGANNDIVAQNGSGQWTPAH